jgi:two-component system, response regulator PdtaR
MRIDRLQLMAAGGSPPPADDSSMRDPFAHPARSLRVLIVEDEALVAMDMEDVLTADGFKIVATVDTERDAIAAIASLRPDIVLLDITLREGNGIAVAQAMAGAAIYLFVSANSDAATLARAQALNPAGFIRKPFIGVDLPRQIRALLAGASP